MRKISMSGKIEFCFNNGNAAPRIAPLVVNFVKAIASVIALALLPQMAQAGVATRIGSGSNHNCVAMSEGGLKCWGSGSMGQLGDGAKVTRPTPVSVPALAGFNITAVGGGSNFTCALTSTGAVYCWGFNSAGQLGDGTYVSSPVPVAVKLPTGPAKGLAVGSTHACLLDTFGNVYCWGANTFGQLNRSSSSIGSSTLPIYAAGMNDLVSISGVGFGICAVDIKGGVKCLGNNSYGQRGTGTKDSNTVNTYGDPIYVTGLSSNVISAASGKYSSCAVTALHDVFCWGQSTVYGQLGVPPGGYYLTPVAVPGTRSDVKAIYASSWHTCGVTVSGAAQCWGLNSFGQLGRGTIANYGAAGDVLSLMSGVNSMSLGENHSCALLDSGIVKCWGLNNLGELGDGTTTRSIIPVTVAL